MDRQPIEIERRRTPHSSSGRGGQRPRAIVVHTTDGGFAASAAWFAAAESGVSAHYLIGLDGRVAQFVDEADTARHAGRVLRPTAKLARGRDDLNPITVGIELEDGGDPEGIERPAAQYEAAAALVAAVCERWEIPLDREHVIGHREVFAAKACPGNVDLERLVAMARSAPRPAEEIPAEPPSLLCLLPVRDGAEDLAGYLRSVDDLGASLVALDDGSSDETAELLRADTRVLAVLPAPDPDGDRRWDDAANRQALLDHAAGTEFDWLLFLDVDERIDADDAAALRGFLATDAVPGLAYGLQLHRTWGDRADPEPRYVYRLFSRRPEMTLPAERLHANPVPVEIARRAWVRTSIRVRHLESAERLRGRRVKYELADPEGAHRADTDTLLEPAPERLVTWPPRSGKVAIVGGTRRLRRPARPTSRARCSSACSPSATAPPSSPTTWRAPGASPTR